MRIPPGASVTKGSGAVVTLKIVGRGYSPQDRDPRGGQRQDPDQGKHGTRHGLTRAPLLRVAHAEQPADYDEDDELAKIFG